MAKRIPECTEYFEYYNANPKDKRVGDCVIRALSKVTGKSWDVIFTALYEIALKQKMMPNDRFVFEKYLKQEGWVKQKQPKDINNKKYTGIDFIKYYLVDNNLTDTKIFANIGAKHVVAIESKTIFDTWNCSTRCIGNYWIKEM